MTMMIQKKFLRIFLIVLTLATIATAIGSSSVAAESADIIVANDGSSNYSSIQNAVTNASSGETVEVLSGTYTESVTITKPITILGKPDPSVRGPGTDAPVLDGENESKNAFELEQGVSNVRIAGFKIRNYGNISAENVTRQNTRGEGIAAYNASTSQVTIQDNYIHSVGWSGIVFSGGGYTPHDNLTISRNKVENIAFYGIETGGIHNSRITNNSVIAGTNTADTIWFVDGNNSDGGIAIWANSRESSVTTQNVTIKNNSVSGPFDQAGIEHLVNDFQSQEAPAGVSAGSQNITISQNKVSGSDNAGIAHLTVGTNTSASDIIISNNTIRGGEIGIEVETDQTSTALPATFKQNLIEDNLHGILVQEHTDPASLSIVQNRIVSNTQNGVSQKGIGELNVAYNYWGATDGPSGNFSGSGDAAVGNLTVKPYYTDSRLTTLSSETGSDDNNTDQNSTTGFVDVDAGDLAGNGTSDDPYVVTNASELQAMEDDLDAHYELGNDINASDTTEWNDDSGFKPLGASNKPFSGSFNGSGYTVDRLTISRSELNNVGLFGVVNESGRIINVSLTNVDTTGYENVGGLVGHNTGVVQNTSFISGNITGRSTVGSIAGTNHGELGSSTAAGNVSGYIWVGGLTGINSWDALLYSSKSSSNITADENTGGLVGENAGTIESSFATGNVSGISNVGGLVGVNRNPIRSSNATGSVNGSGNVGGLVGKNNDLIESSFALGSVNGSSSNVGGLIGANYGEVTESFSRGDVNSTDRVGGLIGNNRGIIKTSYTTGNVTGYSRVGGLVGSNADTIDRSYVKGVVDGNKRVGGLVGTNAGYINESYASGPVYTSLYSGGLVAVDNDGSVSGSYWDLESSNQSASDGGTGLSTSEMTGLEAETNMAAFNFSKTWQTQPNDYPVLSWQNNTTGEGSAALSGADVTSLDGTNTTVTFDLKNTGETNSSYILNLSLPEGWTAVDYDNDGGDRQDGEAKWLWQTITPNETVTASVTMEVPENTEGTYTVSGDVLSNDSIVVQTDATVTVFDGNLTASLDEHTIANGSETALTVEAPQTDGSFTDVTADSNFSSNNTDIATVDADGTVTAVGTGTAVINATYEGQTATVTLTVEPASVVEAIDADNDGEIGDIEILTAIDYWQNDEAVPQTAGETIGDFEILDLISKWRTNIQI